MHIAAIVVAAIHANRCRMVCTGMEPTVRRWSSVHEFLAEAGLFLAAREAEHCLMLGLSTLIAAHPAMYPEAQFWTVHEAGLCVGAALRTPPHNLVLSQLDEVRWQTALIDSVLGEDLPGALGPTAAVRKLADAWSVRAGKIASRVMQERIFRLDRVVAPRPCAGAMREADAGDRALLVAWIAAFAAEALTNAQIDPVAMADQMVQRAGRVPYLWEVDGEVVAFAAVTGPTPRGIRVGPVYTPPAKRGHGYASNLVAAVSQRQLDGGRSFCFLFTDLANPTSNRIYQAIGYAPVVDVEQYRFAY